MTSYRERLYGQAFAAPLSSWAREVIECAVAQPEFGVLPRSRRAVSAAVARRLWRLSWSEVARLFGYADGKSALTSARPRAPLGPA